MFDLVGGGPFAGLCFLRGSQGKWVFAPGDRWVVVSTVVLTVLILHRTELCPALQPENGTHQFLV